MDLRMGGEWSCSGSCPNEGVIQGAEPSNSTTVICYTKFIYILFCKFDKYEAGMSSHKVEKSEGHILYSGCS